jgi:hypothetical protein
MENKNSFFFLTLTIPEARKNKIYLDKLNDLSDLVFSSINASNTFYKFESLAKKQIVFLFKTESRKRRGQLVRLCDKLLPKDQEYNVGGLTRVGFWAEIEKMKNNKNYKFVDLFVNNYTGGDLIVFNDRKKWHPWQREIFDKIWNRDGTYQKPDPRHILSIIDETGNSGKSSFFKWLYYNNPNTIGRIGYGSASQLRSCLTNIGEKNLYIIDLARTKGRYDSEEDLLSALEDLKSGFITNSMYGSGKNLLIPPPHIIVSSNYMMKYEFLSGDRWEVYKINSMKELIAIKGTKPSFKSSLNKSSNVNQMISKKQKESLE